MSRALFVRLAGQNLSRRRLRSLLLGAAVALAVGVITAAFIVGLALRDTAGTGLSRMGADLVVVPRAALVNLTSSLLTAQPTDETLDAAMVQTLSRIDGVARAAPQRLVHVVVEGHAFDLIAFDPASDFTVQTWMREQRAGPLAVSDLIAGSRVPGAIGQRVSVCRQPLEVQGRLAATSVGTFDESYFIPFAGLDMLAALCSKDPVLHGAHAAANVCMPSYTSGRVSAVLLQLAPNARIEHVKFAIAQLPDVKAIEGNPTVSHSRQTLRALFIAIGVFSLVVVAALLILVSLVFSSIVQERFRELGLLRAIGAKPNDVLALVVAEAAMVTSLGGVGGLILGLGLLTVSARALGLYFEALGARFAWPSVDLLLVTASTVIALSMALGVAGALYPAWRVRRMEPHALIRGEAAL